MGRIRTLAGIGATRLQVSELTNVFGALAVTQAALPLLREAPSPRVVMVSSGVGSLATASQPGNRYRAMFGRLLGPRRPR